MSTHASPHTRPTPSLGHKAIQILAKSLFRELTSQGYSVRQIVGLATALLGEVTATLGARPGQR
ncbi:MAG: hypothetical protein SFX73_10740 [Kofleriaceae bacterium]|nr:hypothetical protein [Kofleriaceae bacterium]